ncbi:hypothetical protein TURU_103081 [Turdus rufiventris]|nr:hypothetical protein TURU_103081 [Turdus rufiventris]
MPDDTSCEEILPDVQSEPPLAYLETTSSYSVTDCLREEADRHLATTSFQAVVDSDKAPLEPPFLHAERPQLPQLLLTGLVLQTIHQLHSLDTFQHLNVLLVVRGPEPNTGFEVWSYQCLPSTGG